MLRKLFHILVLLLVISNWMTPVALGASRSTIFPVAPKKLSPYLQYVPDSLTSVTTTHSQIWQISVTNDCHSSVTFYVIDRATVPKVLVSNRVSLTAGQTVIFEWQEGVAMQNGFRWQAGTASCLNAAISGTYI